MTAISKPFRRKTHVYQEMRTIGLFLWLVGSTRLYRDGDGYSVICRAWHPVIWLALVLMVVPCALMGERILEVFPFRLSAFWKANRDQLRWVTPFTKISDIPRFIHRPATAELA